MRISGEGEAARQCGLRADAAARSVTASFGHRLLGLPGTFIGSPHARSGGLGRPSGILEPWHYWWQAHFLDCLVDAAWREHAGGRITSSPGAPSARVAAARWHRLAVRLLRTIKLRNGNRWNNHYYDDMAWLALASGRLKALTDALDARRDVPAAKRLGVGKRSSGDLGMAALASIIRQLESAATADLGGGVFWSTKRDFKNAPSTAPAALVFARNERKARAQQLINWLNDYLLDPHSGLYYDGIRHGTAEPIVERVLYSYNQGPILAALLEVGGQANLRRAQELIAAVERHFMRSTPVAGALRAHGGGDRGLFTGILARYLALAANRAELPEANRKTAAAMVHGTAEALWIGREHRAGHLRFSADPARPSAGTDVELSTQLQAWMILEAAASAP